jgi:hypothetical protein
MSFGEIDVQFFLNFKSTIFWSVFVLNFDFKDHLIRDAEHSKQKHGSIYLIEKAKNL